MRKLLLFFSLLVCSFSMFAQRPMGIKLKNPIICYARYDDCTSHVSAPEEFLRLRNTPTGRIKTSTIEIDFINFPEDANGIGSDYDGVGDSLPTGLKDVSQYPNLIFVLLKRGYTPEDIEKICSKNLFRVWNKVESMSH